MWAEGLVRESGASRVLDPFAGCGTTLVAAQQAGVESVGVEAHPFLHRVSTAKLRWTDDPDSFAAAAETALTDAAASDPPAVDDFAPLMRRMYDDASLDRLARLRAVVPDGLPWLALVSILRACSGAGTAPWQYVLPRKRKARVAEPYAAFAAQYRMMLADMQTARGPAPPATVLASDARTCVGVDDASIDLVVTSPPYPNNFDYADATRVELTFLGEVERWADLQGAVRHHLIRACSQHASAERLTLAPLLAEPLLAPIAGPLGEACHALEALRVERRGRKAYHTMVAAYFTDLARVWQALARVTRPGAAVCLVVGDSAPYGVHIPVERWLAKLAEATGFEALRFEKTRARNVKWLNRKHRVPLHEGRLWATRAS